MNTREHGWSGRGSASARDPALGQRLRLPSPQRTHISFKTQQRCPIPLAGLPSTTMSSIPPPEMTNRSTPPSSLSKSKDSTTPADIDIPDNYVSWALKTQKAAPPFRWDNLINELNWLNVAILTVPPLLTIYAILYVPLQTRTCLFSIFYYFVTGLGGLSFNFTLRIWHSNHFRRYHCRLPSSLGPPVV